MSCQGFSGIWCLAFFYVWEQPHIRSNPTHVCFAVLSTLIQSWPVKATGTLRLSAFHNRYVSFISEVSKSEQRYEHLSTIAILATGRHWLRTPLAGGCMAVVGMHPQRLTQDEVETKVQLLRKYFVDGPGKDSGITSMYLHFDITRYRKMTSLRDH
ncbi:uncharacterized protein LOC135829085 [Sycon ciliatum]|uniref:uncharacterized protein LOC135829085 n=1 Tax=Sycon ciliatum TaxID=27933 RepID=UPI0031F69490